MKIRIPGEGDMAVPFVVPQEAGTFASALLCLPVGTSLLAYGDRISWKEYVKLWSKITGVAATLEKVTVVDHAKLLPGGFGEEIGEMYGYMQDFGYDGSDPKVTLSENVCDPRSAHRFSI